MHTNKDLSSYLKGFAILTVISAHFSIRFLPEQIMPFGNHFIAIFFILSGYGLYFSLKRKKDTNRDSILLFYFKRFVRIYPLYWINFTLDLAFDPSSTIAISSVLDFLLLNFTDPPRVWFLHALIPCYVLAPSIFKLINKTRELFILYVIIFFMVVNIVFTLLEVPQIRCWMYRGIYLNHIILFCIGMYLPIIRERYGKIFGLNWIAISFLLMLFSFIQTSELAFNFLNYKLLNQLLFSMSTILFTFIFMFSNVHPPFFRILKKIGIYTFSLYLFEGMFATVLNEINIIEGQTYLNAFWFSLLFPVFFFLAAILEEAVNNKFNIKKALINTKAILISG